MTSADRSLTRPPVLTLPGTVRAKLSALRRAIRSYVVWEMIAWVVLWMVVTFWVFLALDYLPVRGGFGEMPRPVRFVFLTLVVAGLAWIVVRFGWRPLAARLSAPRLAVAYERYFPQLSGALVGAVELAQSSSELAESPLGLELATRTAQRADELAAALEPRRMLNWPRLRSRIVLALAAVATVLALATWQPAVARLAAARLYGLSNQPWPRMVYLEVLGFDDNQRKVARGGSVELRVRADAERRVPPPATCGIYYRAADGTRGVAVMSRDGEARGGYQHYVYRGKPFQSIQEDIVFTVAGGDFRTSEYSVLAVDQPSLVQLDLVYQPPTYTGLAQQRRPWTPGLRVPQGADVVLEGTGSKPLRQVQLASQQREDQSLPSWEMADDGRGFRIPIGRLVEPVSFDLALLDADGIVSPQPYAIRIQPIDDKPPEVGLRVSGIGNAITPDARLPFQGKIVDDYDVKAAWFTVELGERKLELPIEVAQGQELQAAVDFRDQRDATLENPLVLEPGVEVTVVASATDYYDIDPTPHLGTIDPLKLKVVRPDQLLAILEARELSLRRRFEDIVGEAREQHDSLLRLQAAWRQLAAETSGAAGTTEAEEADETEDNGNEDAEGGGDAGPSGAATASDESAGAEDGGDAEGEDQPQRTAEAASLRELRIQRLIQFNQKATGELAGLAAAFEDILVELDNNRVNSAEREQRLRELIITPLTVISRDQLPAFDAAVREVERQLADAAQAGPLTDQAVVELERIIASMDAILENMLKMESFKEVLDLLRDLLEEQQQLRERTQEQQRRELLEGLLPE